VGAFIVDLFNGLAFGMILFLIAAGLSLIMGVMGILNLAHGALYMVGGYIGWTVAVHVDMGFWAGALAAALCVAVVGFALERLLLRRLHGRFDEQVLATLGVTYILTNAVIWIWGAEPKVPFAPSVFGGSTSLFGERYATVRIALIVIGLVLAVALWWLQDRTRLGAMVRAGMDDAQMSRAMGINVGAISAAVFAFGSLVVGFSGVLGQQIIGVNPDLGLSMLLLALVVLIVGGVGSVQGALLGAVLIGLVNSYGTALFPALAAFLPYAAMILVLVVRPHGLLGRPELVRR
jgi:branched-chain amino acid transport system permease protein